MGQPSRPRRRQRCDLRPSQGLDGAQAESDGAVPRRKARNGQRALRGEPEPSRLTSIPFRIDGDHGLERRAGPAETADLPEHVQVGLHDGAQQTAPREEDGDRVHGAVQLGRQLLGRGMHEERILRAAALRLSGSTMGGHRERIAVGVDADEEAFGLLTGEAKHRLTVAGSEVDGHPSLVARHEGLDELTIHPPGTASLDDEHDALGSSPSRGDAIAPRRSPGSLADRGAPRQCATLPVESNEREEVDVEVRFLGAGDAFGGHGRLQACIMLSGAGEPVLLDCGMTSLAAMKRAGVDPFDIGYVFVSHHHADHFGGVPLMILEGQAQGRTKPLTVAGPPGTGDRVWRFLDTAYPGTVERERDFDVRFVDFHERESIEVGPATVTPFQVKHTAGPSPAFGMRVRYGGRTIAYTGDTAWTDALLDLSRDADLFISECLMYDREVPNHLTYQGLVQGLTGHPHGRLVLTHTSAELLAHRDEFDAEVADDGTVISL